MTASHHNITPLENVGRSDSVRKTSTTLADGRELIYFDDNPTYVSGEKTRRLDDPRPLTDRFTPVVDEDGTVHPIASPWMRQDPLTGEWVPMATHRMNRTFLPPADANPLAPAKPGADYSDGEIPDTDYDVVVFENRFPSLLRVPDADPLAKPEPLDGQELFLTRPATGRCEVICFSPRLEDNLAEASPQRMRTVIEAWADRTAHLMAMPGIEQVFCFENHGKEMGVTLPHPHGQIYAYPYIAPRMQLIAQRAAAHREKTGRDLVGDVLAAELESGRRIIAQNEHWVLYVPSAGRWPVEMHLVPRRFVAHLNELTDEERDSLAEIYLHMLQAGNRFFVEEDGSAIELPYVAGWHQAPRGHEQNVRLHLQLFSVLRSPGRLKYLAGSESGMAAWVSDTVPEKIADRLREIW